jgi:hypothetical protein
MRTSPDDYYYQQGGGYGTRDQGGEEEQTNDLSTNAQLLKEVLENQKSASPTNIAKTLKLFMLDEHTFINQPNALNALLHSMFNPITAQGAFNLFMQMRPKYVQQPGEMMGNSGSDGISTYNLGEPQYFMLGGTGAYAAKLAMEERREMLEEKRWDKYMRNMMMINMQRMMGAQTLMIGDPSGIHAGIGAMIREELARLLKDYDIYMTTIQKEITSYMKAFRQRKESTLLKPTGENA